MQWRRVMLDVPPTSRSRQSAGGGAPAVVRCCRAGDLRALEWGGAFRAHRHIFEETFARHQRGGARMLVAEVGGQLAGQIWIELEKRPVPELWALRVHPAQRGRGLGALLLRAAESELAGRGVLEARITAEPANHRALSLYRRLGFRDAAARVERFGYRDPDWGWIERRLFLRVLAKRVERA